MSVSESMTEIRKIRNENSARHLRMTKDERRKEAEQALEWLTKKSNKPLRIVKN